MCHLNQIKFNNILRMICRIYVGRKLFILWHNEFKFKSDIYTGLKTDLVTKYKTHHNVKKLVATSKNSSQRHKKLVVTSKNAVVQITSLDAVRRVVTSCHELFCAKKLVVKIIMFCCQKVTSFRGGIPT